MTHHESNRNYCTDNNKTSYIFGFKQNGIWVVVPHRFILSGFHAKLYGQFISSTWFNHTFSGDKEEYLLLGINKSFKYSDIVQTINTYDTDSDNLNISQEESHMGITCKEKFTLLRYMIQQMNDDERNVNLKEYASSTVHLHGKYDEASLYLSIHTLPNGTVYITLPDFTLK